MTALITADAVARLLGLDSARQFLTQRARLEDDHMFPLPFPVCRRPLKWRRDEVARWVETHGLPRATPTDAAAIRAAGPNIVLLKEAARP